MLARRSHARLERCANQRPGDLRLRRQREFHDAHAPHHRPVRGVDYRRARANRPARRSPLQVAVGQFRAYDGRLRLAEFGRAAKVETFGAVDYGNVSIDAKARHRRGGPAFAPGVSGFINASAIVDGGSGSYYGVSVGLKLAL